MHEHHGHDLHHEQGWRPIGPRHRWLEPFVLVQIAREPTHGYSLAGRLNAARVAPRAIDVGELYRTLRELELAGLVESLWVSPESGARRREYDLTDAGWARLSEWADVMRERSRLVAEFLSEFELVEAGTPAEPPSSQEA